MKSDSHRDSRMEGLVSNTAAEPRLKLELMKPDSLNIGKKPRRLIRKPSSDAPQPESPQQADEGRSSSPPLAVDQTKSAIKDLRVRDALGREQA